MSFATQYIETLTLRQHQTKEQIRKLASYFRSSVPEKRVTFLVSDNGGATTLIKVLELLSGKKVINISSNEVSTGIFSIHFLEIDDTNILVCDYDADVPIFPGSIKELCVSHCTIIIVNKMPRLGNNTIATIGNNKYQTGDPSIDIRIERRMIEIIELPVTFTPLNSRNVEAHKHTKDPNILNKIQSDPFIQNELRSFFFA